MAEIQIALDEQLLAVLFDKSGLQLYPGGLRIVQAGRAVREGDPIAIDSGLLQGNVAKYSQLAADADQAALVVTLDDAHPFEVGDVATFDDGAALQEIVTISAINYTTNVVTFTPAIIDVAGFDIDDHFSVVTANRDEAVGIALTPLRDKRAAELGGLAEDVTPRERTTMYGDLAITGRFRLARLRNLVDGTTPQNFIDADFAGLAIPDVGVTPGLYVITVQSANLSLT